MSRRVCAVPLLLFALSALLGGCATVETSRTPPASHVPFFDAGLYVLPPDIIADDLGLEINDRAVVKSAHGESLLRVRFSFVSIRGFPLFDDVHRSSGAVFLPVGADGRADPANDSQVLVTEFPPGSSSSGFDLYEEYGERPAVELGVPAAIIDLRGPIVSSLGLVRNPYDPADGVYKSEEQFALGKLHEFAETADFGSLYEMRLGRAWLRALKSLNRVLADEMTAGTRRYILVGEGYGALSALQAGAAYGTVQGVVMCGWPLDWLDLQFTRWRRWEREARYYPLEKSLPGPYDDSRALLSFLSSSFRAPDPGCPACEAGGDQWLAQFNPIDLRAAGELRGLRTFLLVGDSDPNVPIDLELRASVPPEAVLELPHEPSAGGASRGPFSREVRYPFQDLTLLRDATSTLAHKEASAAVLGWVQHFAGFRDIPRVTVEETEEDGEVKLAVSVLEGNAAVSHVDVRLLEIGDIDDSDFRAPLHKAKPEPLAWRTIEAIYAGPSPDSRQRWNAFLPVSRTTNRAYIVTVRDRVGDLEAEHSLPARPFWYLGDPASGPARF